MDSTNVYIIIAADYNPRNPNKVCEYVYLSHDFEEDEYFWSVSLEDAYTFNNEKSAKYFIKDRILSNMSEFSEEDIHIEKAKINY